MSIYERGLDRNPANHQPLTPLSFLKRAARVWPERTASHPWRSPPQLCRALRPLAPARLGADELASAAATRWR